ncbi:hypothetical protein N0V88_005164 [Collariella sp. IMI 366227]|nr:hypothetical protein N0V88_005164 [Collariella sp. IMI 366227]
MASLSSTTAVVIPNAHRGILDLPVELIWHICSFFSPCCFKAKASGGCFSRIDDRIQLSVISRTCRTLRDIAQPLVFHCFSDWGGSNLSRLIRLIRTLKKRPDLAQYVKSIAHTIPFAGDLDAENKKVVEDAITDLGLPPVNQYWNIDGEGEYRLLSLEVLLTMTHNLEALQLPLDYDWRLHATASTTDYITPSTPLLPFTNLHRLLFHANCAVDPAYLAHMLTSAPQLEVVALHWAALADVEEDCEDRRTTDAWDALERRRDTLREIRLDIRNDVEHGRTERCSLADFERLEVLAVEGHALWSLREAWERRNRGARAVEFLAEFFPSSIREVKFWSPDAGELMPAMLKFAKAVAVGRYPNLRRVVIAPSTTMEQWAGDEWKTQRLWDAAGPMLKGEFRRGGVTLEIWGEGRYWRAFGSDDE